MLVEDLKLPTLLNKTREGLLKTNGNTLLSAISSTKYKETQVACRKVYAQRLSRSRSSKRPVPQKTEARTHSRTGLLNEHSKKPQKSAKKSDSLVQSLLYASQKAASDLVELQRDLATYDHNLLLNTRLHKHLEEIQTICTGMANLDVHFEVQSQQVQGLSEIVTASFQEIAGLPPQQSCSQESAAESYAMKRPAFLRERESVYQAAALISGQECLVSVKASNWALHFAVHCCLGFTSEYTHPARILQQNRVEQAKKVLSQLRFDTADDGSFVLRLEKTQESGRRWVLACIRNLGLCCLHLVARDVEQLDVSISQRGLCLTIPRIKGFETVRLTKLRKWLSQYLDWDSNTNQLRWATALHSREERSLLMNEAYIREAVATANYTHCLSFVISLDRREIRVDLAKSDAEVSFTLTCGERTVQLDNSSKLSPFVLELQGLQAASQVQTLCKSLEFQYAVRQLLD